MQMKFSLTTICFCVVTFIVSAQSNINTPVVAQTKTSEPHVLLAEAKIQTSDYSEGWNQGYKDGWCYGKGYGCYPAYPPYPPYPRYGEDSYKDGYNRAFLQALKDRDN